MVFVNIIYYLQLPLDFLQLQLFFQLTLIFAMHFINEEYVFHHAFL